MWVCKTRVVEQEGMVKMTNYDLFRAFDNNNKDIFVCVYAKLVNNNGRARRHSETSEIVIQCN